ncbi:MAG TPA: hypothetical protein VFI25_02285 [Planctomycetota bacterium]|nr:hypothetical protein [Planctomycetota bacterium]
MSSCAERARGQSRTGGFVGVAGEHFVAAELARRGFLVTLTRGNAPGVDVLAYRPGTRRTVALQVKATVRLGGWIMTPKDEGEPRSDAFVFVFLPEHGPPEYSVVPSREVAETIRVGFKKYLETPGKNGRRHDPENRVRYFNREEGEKWRGRWDVITSLAEVDAAT